jgi:hypothetical protein
MPASATSLRGSRAIRRRDVNNFRTLAIACQRERQLLLTVKSNYCSRVGLTESSKTLGMQPPEFDETRLLEALRAPNVGHRDPREITTLVERSQKPLLLIDEIRENDCVIWSCVALDGRSAWDINVRMAAAVRHDPLLRKTSGNALLTGTSEAIIGYRRLIEEALGTASVLRTGITFDSLREWRRQTRFARSMAPTGKQVKKGEFAAICSLIRMLAERMNLFGLVVAIVDSAIQNGLYPSQLGVTPGEHATILIDHSERPILLWASTPESCDVGALLDVPDFDAARSRTEPEYRSFLERVRTAPLGTMIYWPP